MAYTVSEAAKLLGIPASTLRYYESVGLLPEVSRTASGRRQFSERDIEMGRMIECLKASGLQLKDIKRFMDMVVAGDATLEDRLALFEAQRARVEEEIRQLQETLAVLDYKRWYYGEAVKAGTEAAVRDLPANKIPEEHQAAKQRIASGTLHTHS